MDLELVDGATAALWVMVNGLLVAGLWRCSRALFPHADDEVHWAFVLLAWWGVVVVALTGLGAAGLIGRVGLLSCGAVVALAVYYIGAGFLRRGPAPGPARSPSVFRWASGGLLAVWAGHALTGGVLPLPTHWDSLTYHIPLVDRWIQSGSLYVPDFSHWSHPGNHELIGVWVVGPFSGDFLIGLCNLPVAALLLFSTRLLAGEAGLSPAKAWLAAGAVGSNAIVFAQVISTENDLAVAALTVAALAFGFRFARGGGLGDLLACAVAQGLLAGIKFYALGYAGVVGVAVAGVAAASRGWSAGGRAAAAGLAATVALSGYWYVRNTLATGSPLYPMGAALRPEHLGQMYPDLWKSTFLGNGDRAVPELTARAVLMMSGPWQLLGLGLLPLTALWLAVSGWASRRVVRVGLAAAAIGAVMVWLVTPYAVELHVGTLDMLRYERTPSRYGLTCLSIAVVVLVAALDAAGRAVGLGAWVTGGAVGLVAVQYGMVGLNPDRGLTPEVARGLAVNLVDTALVASNLIILYLAYSTVGADRPRTRLAFLGALLVAIGSGAGLLTRHWASGYTSHYDQFFHDGVFSNLARQPCPLGTRVCVLDDRPYPFFGAHRQFQVAVPYVLGDEGELMWFLEQHRVEYLVTRSRENSSPTNVPHNRLAVEWCPRLGHRLRQTASSSGYVIYRVIRE